MHCTSIQRLIYEAVDRALTPDERRRVDAHLTGCERCRSEATVLDAMIETVETAPAAQPSEAFLSSVMEKLPAPARSPEKLPAPARSSRFAPWFAPSLVFPRLVFAFTLAAAAVVWLYREVFAEFVGNLLPVQTVTGSVMAAAGDLQAYVQSQAGAVVARLPEPVSTSVDWSSMLLVATTLAVGYLLIRAAENPDAGNPAFRIGRRY